MCMPPHATDAHPKDAIVFAFSTIDGDDNTQTERWVEFSAFVHNLHYFSQISHSAAPNRYFHDVYSHNSRRNQFYSYSIHYLAQYCLFFWLTIIFSFITINIQLFIFIAICYWQKFAQTNKIIRMNKILLSSNCFIIVRITQIRIYNKIAFLRQIIRPY